MGGALDSGEGVGDEEGSELVGLSVGIDDHDGAAGGDLAHGVVGVGHAEREVARADGHRDLLVALKDLGVVGLEVEEELLGLLFAPLREQAGGLGPVVPNRGLAMAILPFHFGSVRS